MNGRSSTGVAAAIPGAACTRATSSSNICKRRSGSSYADPTRGTCATLNFAGEKPRSTACSCCIVRTSKAPVTVTSKANASCAATSTCRPTCVRGLDDPSMSMPRNRRNKAARTIHNAGARPAINAESSAPPPTHAIAQASR